MNRFDTYITLFLHEHKEVGLEKIGIIKTAAPGAEPRFTEFIFDKKAATSEELINFISEKTAKNKSLIRSDLESHFSQAREFINIGKNYELPEIGFIKATKNSTYEFVPYSEINKPAKSSLQPDKRQKQSSNRSFVQIITLLIVIAILAGLGWQAYQFFSKPKPSSVNNAANNHVDATMNKVASQHTDTAASQPVIIDSTNDTINVRYIFETTASGLRARTKTAQLKSFGNNAGFDSFMKNSTMFYSLYIIKPTKITDTVAVKDSLAKFFEKDIKLEIEPRNRQ